MDNYTVGEKKIHKIEYCSTIKKIIIIEGMNYSCNNSMDEPQCIKLSENSQT